MQQRFNLRYYHAAKDQALDNELAIFDAKRRVQNILSDVRGMIENDGYGFISKVRSLRIILDEISKLSSNNNSKEITDSLRVAEEIIKKIPTNDYDYQSLANEIASLSKLNDTAIGVTLSADMSKILDDYLKEQSAKKNAAKRFTVSSSAKRNLKRHSPLR